MQWFVMDEKLFQIGPLRNRVPNATSFLIPHDINKRIGEFLNLPGCQNSLKSGALLKHLNTTSDNFFFLSSYI